MQIKEVIKKNDYVEDDVDEKIQMLMLFYQFRK